MIPLENIEQRFPAPDIRRWRIIIESDQGCMVEVTRESRLKWREIWFVEKEDANLLIADDISTNLAQYVEQSKEAMKQYIKANALTSVKVLL